MTGRVRAMCLAMALGLAVGALAGVTYPQGVASGDPRPDSVVLWTRVEDPEAAPDADLAVTVEVATDPEFSDVVWSRTVTAEAAHDRCVKVLVTGLVPDTVYWYRFRCGGVASRVGRTRTAPPPDSERLVRFAVLNCQDYVGRYYNSLVKLLRDHPDDLDFLVHLGDSVYETTGDPSFQAPDPARRVEFRDLDGAIRLGDPEHPYWAASSLANYRTLHETYRSDPALQDLYASYPVIAIWDDHEFSNDSWDATSVYTNGRRDERDPERRRHAETAFFEFTPTEVGIGPDGTLEVDDAILYPNTRIYRDFRFGRTLHLVLTDYRTYRPDHLVPEDAFPGAIAVTQPELEALLGPEGFAAVRDGLDPYLDLDLFALTAMGGVNIARQTATAVLAQAYAMENPELDLPAAMERARAALAGPVSATYLNLLFAAAGLEPPVPASVMASLPHGLSYLYVGKQSLYSSTGSRYLVLTDAYRLLAAARAAASGGASEDVYGPQQMAWLQGALLGQPATWNVLASSTSMTPMVLDFTNPALASQLPAGFPDVFRNRLTLNVDQWDGFPNMREALLGLLRTVPNPVVISGDIHAGFVTDHGGVYEFTSPAISSNTLQGEVLETARGVPGLGDLPELPTLVQALDLFLMVSAQDDVHVSPSDILAAMTWANGYTVMEAGPEAFRAVYTLLPAATALQNLYGQPAALDAIATVRTFEVHDGALTEIAP